MRRFVGNERTGRATALPRGGGASLPLLALLVFGGGPHLLAQNPLAQNLVAENLLAQNPLTIPRETPLRVQVTHTVRLKAGEPFEGKLLEAVYGPDRMLLPAGLIARGVVDATPAADRGTRINARLDGDFTPLREPVIRVTQLVLPSGEILPLSATGAMRDAEVVSLGRRPEKTSIMGQLKERVSTQVKQGRQTLHDTLHGTGVEQQKGDRLRKLLYAQLPYHPQKVWAGSSFDVVLARQLNVPAAAAAQPAPRAPGVDLASGTLHARLTGTVSSLAAAKGDAVTAVLTQPFCDAAGRMMLPTGTPLNGVVVQAEPARWFGRSGKLRFSFRSVAAPGATPGSSAAQGAMPAASPIVSTVAPVATPVAIVSHAPAAADAAPDGGNGQDRKTGAPVLSTRSQAAATPIAGHLHSIDAVDGQNVALDPEGGARAQPDKGRFLAPLMLGILGASSQDDDGGILRQGVTSNGFGIPARVLTVALASPNLSSGFAAYAFSKSIWKRWIARGHEVTFPKFTEMAIDLGRR